MDTVDTVTIWAVAITIVIGIPALIFLTILSWVINGWVKLLGKGK